MRWVASEPRAKASYEAALCSRSELYAEEIVQIADTEPDANKARVRIDARKWVAAKLLPKKYGDITTLEVQADKNLVAVTALETAREVLFMLNLADRERGQPEERKHAKLAITHVPAPLGPV